MSTIPLLNEILAHPRFIDLQKKEPMQAFSLYQNIKQGLETDWVDFIAVRDNERELNRCGRPKDGRMVAYLPQAIITWIKFLEYQEPSKKTVLKEFLKNHPEFCTRKMTVR